MSLTNIDIDEKQSIINISIKVFTDDFENLLSENCKSNKINQENIECINLLLSNNIKLNINDKNQFIKAKFISFKPSNESTWINYKLSYKGKLYSISLINNLFFNKFGDQNNLMIIKRNDKEEGYQIKKMNQEIKLKLY